MRGGFAHGARQRLAWTRRRWLCGRRGGGSRGSRGRRRGDNFALGESTHPPSTAADSAPTLRIRFAAFPLGLDAPTVAEVFVAARAEARVVVEEVAAVSVGPCELRTPFPLHVLAEHLEVALAEPVCDLNHLWGVWCGAVLVWHGMAVWCVLGLVWCRVVCCVVA